MFNKILIANRGEIACRVMKTAQTLGIKTVAVFSEADRHAMHVEMADEAYCIGPPPSSESYLRQDKILEICHRSGAQAIHPGYGFLSENPSFAELCAKEDVVFIGPPASAIRSMGSKSESKYIMENAKVPTVPGYHGDNQQVSFLREQAKLIGYPVLIKAIKGGGGKGMRIVRSPDQFDEMLEASKRESLKSFSDDKVLIEKYLLRPRHIEVQVFADNFGNAVYLFERDCSVQRRHQKILEEAPAPHLSWELRRELGEKAVAAAKAVNYRGAGTVEFIMDTEDNRFYFMEMNTRLQVEHPVTELVTGTDLVHWQLLVASGNPLPVINQSELELKGHAFEARIYAENPSNNFMPDIGPLLRLKAPETRTQHPIIRYETGIRQGDEVSVYYDPMIAKLVVHGNDREEALRVLRKALDQYEVAGLSTNIDFLKRLSSHPAFIAGEVETGFIEKHFDDLFPKQAPVSAHLLAAAALRAISLKESSNISSPWKLGDNWRLNSVTDKEFKFIDGKLGEARVIVTCLPGRTYNIKVIDSAKQETLYTDCQAELLEHGSKIRANLGDRLVEASVVEHNDDLYLFDQEGKTTLSLPGLSFKAGNASSLAAAGGGDSEGVIKSPMSCKISQVFVTIGQEVEQGTTVMLLEAMKMEHSVKAPKSGKIKQIHVKAGDLAAQNKILVEFDT